LGNNKPWLNGSGCSDPTAYIAMKNIQREKSIDDNAHKVISTIKNVLDLSGFELTGRIEIRHKKSGRIYK
jgi:hypothetical protein